MAPTCLDECNGASARHPSHLERERDDSSLDRAQCPRHGTSSGTPVGGGGLRKSSSRWSSRSATTRRPRWGSLTGTAWRAGMGGWTSRTGGDVEVCVWAPERWLRRRVNPLSTGITTRWYGGGPREVPSRSPGAKSQSLHQRSGITFFGVRSPGGWQVPAGERPGWSWLPPGGAVPNLRRMPRWVRIWFLLPFVDRYAHSWMWHNGGWLLQQSDGPSAPPDVGDREPRNPRPPTPNQHAAQVPSPYQASR